MAHTLTDLTAPRSHRVPRRHLDQSDFNPRGSPTDPVLPTFSFPLEMAEIFIPFSYTLLLPLSNIFFSHWSKDKKGGPRGKESTCQWRRSKRCGFSPWVRKIPWRRAWQPTPILLPREFHGQGSLVGYRQRVGHDWSDLARPFMTMSRVGKVVSGLNANICCANYLQYNHLPCSL